MGRATATQFPQVTAIRCGTGHPEIGDMPRFSARSEFWSEVRMQATQHLALEASHGRPSIGDPRAQRQAAVTLLWFALSYGALLYAPTLLAALAAALSLGFAAAAVGFGIFHDANHGTLFRRPAANLLGARICSALLGPSRHFWVLKHGHHHRQPNVFGWDDDLETRGVLRLSPECSWEPRFRRQELKAILFYGLNTIEWLFWKDFRCLASGRLNKWHTLDLGTSGQLEFLVSKSVYLLVFVVPPFLTLPLTSAIAAFILFHLVFSWVLAAVFQIAHLTPGMEFNGVRSDDDWALHQMRTTANFAAHSRFATWFTGGLNHQIEHHLFPNVAHTHFSGLRPIVRAAAERHGVCCHDLGSFSCALKQHFILLKALGACPLAHRTQ
jgi:linoleoyl-CoA desaturase